MEMDLEEAALGEVGEVTAPSGHTQAPEEGKGGASDKLRTTREEMEVGEDKIDEGRVAEAEGNNAEAEGGGYCALMEFCLIALDKRPGVRPIGIGEKLHQAIAKLVMRASGDQAKAAYRIHQLCTGLEAGIEGVTHAVAQRRRERTVTAPEGMGEEELEDMVLWKWT